MRRSRFLPSLTSTRALNALTMLALVASAPLSAQATAQNATPATPLPSAEDPRIHDMVAASSAERIERDIRTLVGFGTRHTMSDTMSTTPRHRRRPALDLRRVPEDRAGVWWLS